MLKLDESNQQEFTLVAEKKIVERAGLRRAMRIAGLTQTDLARKLRVTTSAVSSWVSGIRTPSASILPPLADHLEITPAQLIDLIDVPLPQ